MKELFKQIGWYYRLKKKSYLLSMLARLFYCGFLFLIPWLSGRYIDAVRSGHLTLPNYLFYLGLILLCLPICYLLTSTAEFSIFTNGFELARRYRNRLMRNYLYRNGAFYHHYTSGFLASLPFSDTNELVDAAGFGIYSLLEGLVLPSVILSLMAILVSWKLTLLAMVPIPIVMLAMNWIGKQLDEATSQRKACSDELFDQTLEMVNSLRMNRAFGVQDYMRARFHTSALKRIKAALRAKKLMILWSTGGGLLTAISYILVYGVGGYEVYHQQLTIGQYVTFSIYLSLALRPILFVVDLVAVIRFACVSLKRIETVESDIRGVPQHALARQRQLMNLQGDEAFETDDLVSIPAAPPASLSQEPLSITVKNLSFTYPGSEQPILKNLQFKIPPNSLVGIVGRTGSGKTTLLRQFILDYPLPEGSIEVNGQCLTQLDPAYFQGLTAYSCQEPHLFSQTLRENVVFYHEAPCPENVDARVESVLEQAGFANDLASLTEGLDTQIGARGITLSGGQKHRVSLARALYKQPRLLLLDDTLSAVDTQTEKIILDHLLKTRSQRTVLLTTHRLSCVQKADWILVLDQGEIIEQGRHEDLMKNKGWYAQQFQLQSLKEGSPCLD